MKKTSVLLMILLLLFAVQAYAQDKESEAITINLTQAYPAITSSTTIFIECVFVQGFGYMDVYFEWNPNQETFYPVKASSSKANCT